MKLDRIQRCLIALTIAAAFISCPIDLPVRRGHSILQFVETIEGRVTGASVTLL
jgi:hypothetical protein